MISKDIFCHLKNEITVYCVSYNFKKTIERCLDSILKQTVSIPIKIYCVDDGSNDGTQEILAKYADKNKKKIKLILSNTNTKKPGSLVSESNLDFDSKYFCQLDGDDYWTDNYNLEKKLKILIGNEKIIGCSSITKMINKNKITLIKAGKTIFNKLDMIAYKKIIPFYCHTSSLLWKNYYYNKKTKLPFPPDYTGKEGDYFFFHQMLNNNHNIYIIPEVLSVYNYTNHGVWSGASIETQNKLNKKIKFRIFYYSPLKYKIFYLIVMACDFCKFKRGWLFNLFFKIFKVKPVNNIEIKNDLSSKIN